jgi:RNA polymerase sigma-70 factor (ECF subfamily)
MAEQSKYRDYSDLELFRRISKKESRALEEIYNRYSPIVYTLLKKICPDEQSANSTLIDVFTIVWEKIHLFDFEAGNVYTWMITLTRNKAVDKLRRDRGGEFAQIPYNDEYENFYILPKLDSKIAVLDIDLAISSKSKIEYVLTKLTDAQKFVIHLAYYEGFTIDEISKRLNIPVETVRNKIMSAMYSLKEKLIR